MGDFIFGCCIIAFISGVFFTIDRCQTRLVMSDCVEHHTVEQCTKLVRP